ncbi:hypothetical protein M2404_003367 [Rheinheimera pacifica]|nr:hypothetical protein [Rheinheimera pacifica]
MQAFNICFYNGRSEIHDLPKRPEIGDVLEFSEIEFIVDSIYPSNHESAEIDVYVKSHTSIKPTILVGRRRS